jgi:uncharacterized protein YjbI with pentapeptide repeats
MEVSAKDAPVFAHANLTGARIIARLSWSDLAGANFAHAKLGADIRNQSMGLMRAEFADADLRGADFADADLAYANFAFAKLGQANFRDARLVQADFSGADLAGADLTGADATGADFGGAVLNGAKGLDTVKGQHLH